jgi:hypothetical protein
MATLFLPSRYQASRLKTSSLAELPRDVEKIENYFHQKQIVLQGYLSRALKTARRIGETWIKNSDDLQPGMTNALGQEILMIRRLSRIIDYLGVEDSDGLRQKLRKLKKHTLDPAHRGHSEGREVLYELEMYTRFKHATKNMLLRSGKGADLFGTFESHMLQVECKYINSLDMIINRVKEAVEQFRVLPTVPGIVSVQVEPHFPHDDFVQFKSASEAYNHLERWTMELYHQLNPRIQALFSNRPQVMAMFYTGHVAAFVDRKNYTDVGICLVTNAAKRVPPGSPMMRTIRSLADALDY